MDRAGRKDLMSRKSKLNNTSTTTTSNQNQLPEGWEEHLDENTGQYFYFHVPTELTTWDPPGSRRHSSVTFRHNSHNSNGDKLPDGWTKHYDENTNAFYFENAGGVSQWEKPSFSDHSSKPSIAFVDRQVSLGNTTASAVGSRMEPFEFENPLTSSTHSMHPHDVTNSYGDSMKPKQQNKQPKTLTQRRKNEIYRDNRCKMISACLLLLVCIGVGIGVFFATQNGIADKGAQILPTPEDGQIVVLSQSLTFSGVAASSLQDDNSKRDLADALSNCLSITPSSRVTVANVTDCCQPPHVKIKFEVTIDPDDPAQNDGSEIRKRMVDVAKTCGSLLRTVVATHSGVSDTDIEVTSDGEPTATVRDKDADGDGGGGDGGGGSGDDDGGGDSGGGGGDASAPTPSPTLPPFSWEDCPTPPPTGQPPSFPRTLTSGNQSPLPVSLETTILTLRRIKRDCTVEILAESYGGFGWHDLGHTSTIMHHHTVPGSPCTVKILPSEAGQYRVDAWMSTRRPLVNHTASRLLLQTTFGPTRTSIADYVNNHNNDPKMWLEAQMSLPPTFLRTYYRQRTNPRMPVGTQSGTVRSACQVGSRWLTYCFTNADVGQILKVYAGSGSGGGRTAGVFTLEIEGVKRTETTIFNGETFSSASVDQTWYVCIVYENDRSEFHLEAQVALNLNQNCKKGNNVEISNPSINFATNDLTITRVFSNADVKMERVTPRQRSKVWQMAAMHGNCNDDDVHSQGGNTYMRITTGPATGFYRLDPRLKLLTNTIKAPADVDPNVDYASQCPLVSRSFVNGGSCVRRAATCSPLAFNERSIMLNETTMRMWYTQSQRYIHYITGLRLENDYQVSPCLKGISRWLKLRDGVCRVGQEPETSLNSITTATLRAVLEASTDSTNPYVRDINIDAAALGACTDANAMGATVELTKSGGGGKECWRHVHPDTYSVYDATIWTVIHDGNVNAKLNKRPNPITAFATAGRCDIGFPAWHAMTRWKDRKKHFNYVGRFGDAVTFQSLPVEMQTLPLANYVGAVQTAPEGGFEACGSRAEYQNEPSLGHHYPFASKFNDLRNIYEELDYPCYSQGTRFLEYCFCLLYLKKYLFLSILLVHI